MAGSADESAHHRTAPVQRHVFAGALLRHAQHGALHQIVDNERSDRDLGTDIEKYA
jgi:hypothetical protein